VEGSVKGGRWLDPKDGCWQGGNFLSRHLLQRNDFDSLQESSVESFQALTRQSIKNTRVLLTPAGKALKKLKLGNRGKQLVNSVEVWYEARGD
jgi:hypothetical protein